MSYPMACSRDRDHEPRPRLHATVDHRGSSSNGSTNSFRLARPGTGKEKLRRMHPDTLRDLTDAGVFKLTCPRRRRPRADLSLISEVLAQIAPAALTSWVTSLITGGTSGRHPADEGAADCSLPPERRRFGAAARRGSHARRRRVLGQRHMAVEYRRSHNTG